MPAAATQPARERTKLAQITDFLAHRRLALIGVSRHPQDITRGLMRELQSRGYEIVPVNPQLETVEGRPCSASVQQIVPPVAAALVFTPVALTDQVVRECASAGVRQLWIRAGAERLDPATFAFCREHGVEVIAGECPYMFLPGCGWFHQVHAWGRKLTGRYPQ